MVVEGGWSSVVPQGTPPPDGRRDLLADIAGITDRPGHSLDQLVGRVIVLHVFGLDFLVHQDGAPLEPWPGRVGYNDDS